MSDVVITQHRFPTPATTVATLVVDDALDANPVFDWAVTVEESAVGTGMLQVPADVDTEIRINDLFRFSIDGTVVGALLVEQIEEHTLDDAGDGAAWIRATGPGAGGVLNWGVIRPANGVGSRPVEETRLFSVFSPQYDDSWWDAAVETTNPAIPAEFPGASGGPWISGPSAGPTSAPAGLTFLRDTFTLASDTEATGFGAGDNWADIYVDGQRILRTGGPDQSNSYQRSVNERLSLSAGTHTVAVRLFNKGPTHSGVRWLLAETNVDGTVATVLHQSDDTWKALETPSPLPGMTPGQAPLIAIDEIQADGGLSWLTWDFDEDLDSNGAAFPVVGDIATQTGNDLLSFLMELSATYIDWAVSPDLVLSVWAKGTHGTASGVTLEPAAVTDPTTGNLVQLDRVRT